MDSPMTQPEVPVGAHSSVKERRALLIIIAVIAVAVLGWLLYTHFIAKPLTVEQERQAILDKVAEDSAKIQTSEAERAATLKQIETAKSPELTAEQRAEILKSVSPQ
jgi:type VI protein secretion system component VasK